MDRWGSRYGIERGNFAEDQGADFQDAESLSVIRHVCNKCSEVFSESDLSKIAPGLYRGLLAVNCFLR